MGDLRNIDIGCMGLCVKWDVEWDVWEMVDIVGERGREYKILYGIGGVWMKLVQDLCGFQPLESFILRPEWPKTNYNLLVLTFLLSLLLYGQAREGAGCYGIGHMPPEPPQHVHSHQGTKCRRGGFIATYWFFFQLHSVFLGNSRSMWVHSH